MKWSELLPQDILQLSADLEALALKEREEGKIIYPPQDKIFRALQITTPDEVKVCIVGQDPYHSPGAANGLAFSISEGCKLQPSIVNIFKELKSDLNIDTPNNGDLTKWAEQGVLLLNTTLTVYEHKPNSHARWGWNKFTNAVLQAAHKLPQPIVYILWGASAIELMNKLTNSPTICMENSHVFIENLKKKAFVLSSHPSPLSAYKTCKGSPSFIGSKPFSTCNQLLQKMNADIINWNLI